MRPGVGSGLRSNGQRLLGSRGPAQLPPDIEQIPNLLKTRLPEDRLLLTPRGPVPDVDNVDMADVKQDCEVISPMCGCYQRPFGLLGPRACSSLGMRLGLENRGSLALTRVKRLEMLGDFPSQILTSLARRA